MSTKPIPLHNWSIVGRLIGPYLLSDSSRCRLKGRVNPGDDPRKPGGDVLVSSSIESVAGRFVTTASGTVYHLCEIDADYRSWLEEQGCVHDPDAADGGGEEQLGRELVVKAASKRLEWGATQMTIGRFVLEIADREYAIGGRSKPLRFVRCRLSLGGNVWGNGYGMTPAEAGADLEEKNGGSVVLDDDERAALVEAARGLS